MFMVYVVCVYRACVVCEYMTVRSVEFILENFCLKHICIYLTTQAFAPVHTYDVAYGVK